MCEVPPCTVTDFSTFGSFPFPSTVSNSSHNNTFGDVSRDGSWAWIARGCLIEIFSTKTRERCGAWCFGAVSKNTDIFITAVVELSSSSIFFPCLIIGLDSESDGGSLCMFNVKTSKVIKVIQLPYKVTSLEAVSGTGGATMDTHTLNNQLRCMFGILSVGTEGGHVLLVDLCLDEENYSDEVLPNKGVIISKQNHNFAAKREIATCNNQHLCLLLNDNSFGNDTYEYRSHNSVLATFPADDVIISSMKYVRSLGVLIVGFNFGGIQIWNLQHLSLETSIPFHSSHQPLVHFAFQEPENDPKNYCYFWAIRGHYQGENYRPENLSTATLYSLCYTRKDWIPRYGYFYQDLQSCVKRFEHALSTNPYSPSSNVTSHFSRLITCHVVPQTDVLSRIDSDDSLQNEDWGCSEDLRLCVMAWENWPAVGDAPSSGYLVLFDINQWYQAQMPTVLRCDPEQPCPYLGVFSLKEIANKMNMDSLLAISILPNSLSKFKCLTVAEEFFYPSSLSIKICCLSTGGLLQASYLGSQRQLLSEMNEAGPNCLIDPKELYKCCGINGLLNDRHDVGLGRHMTVSLQREALLTVALENSMCHFLNMCVQKWKTGELLPSGCSSKFLLEWVWKKVTHIKSSIDKLCQPLFNCSGRALDESTLLSLHSFKRCLKHLSDMMDAFQNLTGPRTELGQQELHLRKEVVDSIDVYLQVLVWLYDCNLLPEHAEGEEYGLDEVAYPVSFLYKIYSCRRSELQKLYSSFAKNDMLLVDGLVEAIGAPLCSMWEKKGGTSSYPPPSIYAAVSTYLIDGVTLPQKHVLMFYLLLDMAAFLSARQAHLIEKLMLFSTAHDFSSSLSKLTHAFWLLDHQDFEAAIVTLLDPGILSVDIAPWQHLRILKSFLFQGQQQKALNYINVRNPPKETAEEIKLHLSILLSNGLIAEAFNYQRQNQSESNAEDLLTHLFLGCQKKFSLDAVLQLPLNPVENTAMEKFLHSSLEPRAPEVLVMFHLLRCCPLEASALNEKLITPIMEQSSKSRERAASRNALVEGFLDTLPEEQKKFAQELNQIYSHVKKIEAVPRPLSTSVTYCSLNHISNSDILGRIIHKYNDISQEIHLDPQTPLRTKTKSYIESTPFICPPITPESRKYRRPSGVVFATPVSKRSLASTSDFNEYSSPLKKPRSFESSSFKMIDSERRRSSKYLTGDLVSLLQTPPICRLSSRIIPADVMDTTPVITPHSILKPRTSSLRPYSPADQIALCTKTPSICSTASNDAENSTDDEAYTTPTNDNQLRHLRFQGVSPESSPSWELPPVITQKKLSSKSSERSLSPGLPQLNLPSDISARSSSPSLPQLNLPSDISARELPPVLSSHRLTSITSERELPPVLSSHRLTSITSERSLRASPRRPLRDENIQSSPSKITHTFLKDDSVFITDLTQDDDNDDMEVEIVGPKNVTFQRDKIIPENASLKTSEKCNFTLHLSDTDDDGSRCGNTNIWKDSSGPDENSTNSTMTEIKQSDGNTIDEANIQSDRTQTCEHDVSFQKSIQLHEVISSKLITTNFQDAVQELKQSDAVIGFSCEYEQPLTCIDPTDQSDHHSDEKEDDKTFTQIHSADILKAPEIMQTEAFDNSSSETPTLSTTLNLDKDIHQTLQSSPYQSTRSRSNSRSPCRTRPKKSERFPLDQLPSPVTCSPLQQMENENADKFIENPVFSEEYQDIHLKESWETQKLSESQPATKEDKRSPEKCIENPVFSKEQEISLKESCETQRFSESQSVRKKEKSKSPMKDTSRTSHKALDDHSQYGSVKAKSFGVEDVVLASIGMELENEKILLTSQSRNSSVKQSSMAKMDIEESTKTAKKIKEKTCYTKIAPAVEVKETNPKVEQPASILTPGDQTLVSEEISRPSFRLVKGQSAGDKQPIRRKSKLGKSSKKMEFSFAEPNTSADHEILDALSSPPKFPVPSFIFSPPTTRARTRKKRLDETLNSTIGSVCSETSFTQLKKHGDSILQDESVEHPHIGAMGYTSPTSHMKKKIVTKKKGSLKSSDTSVSKATINLLSPMPENVDAGKSTKTSSQHSMTLRRSRIKKKKSVKLF